MSLCTTKKREEFTARRAQRYGIVGRDMERRVHGILLEMVKTGLIDHAVYNLAYSREDVEGKDFTVRKGGVELSFGITISHPKLLDHKMKHPDVVQIHTPINMTDKAIVRRVLSILEEGR
jgi:hypothetical protein